MASPTSPLYSWRVWALKARSLRKARGSRTAPGVVATKAAAAARPATTTSRRTRRAGSPAAREKARSASSPSIAAPRAIPARARPWTKARADSGCSSRASGRRRLAARAPPGGPARARPAARARTAAESQATRSARAAGPRRRIQRAASAGATSAAAVYLVEAARPRARPSAQAGARAGEVPRREEQGQRRRREHPRLGRREVAQVDDTGGEGQEEGRHRGGPGVDPQGREAEQQDGGGPGQGGEGPRGEERVSPGIGPPARQPLLQRDHRRREEEGQRRVDVGVGQRPALPHHRGHDVGLLVGVEAGGQPPADAGEVQDEGEDGSGEDEAALGHAPGRRPRPGAAPGGGRGRGRRCRGGTSCRRTGCARWPRTPGRSRTRGWRRARSRPAPGRPPS